MATTDSGLSWEARLWAQGVLRVAGVDEAGRGALAGPVVAAAVLLRPGQSFSSLVRDSKTLSPRQREQALREIEAEAWAIGIGVVEVETIEAINIKQASRLAMRQAVEALNPSPEHLLVDAEELSLPIPQHTLVKGDRHSQAIAAASIVAKVTRDRMAQEWDRRFPEYGFCRHKGYGTREHREVLTRLGPCRLHRKSFLTKVWVDLEREAAATRETVGDNEKDPD